MYRVVDTRGVGDGDVEGRSWESGGVVDVSNAASLTTPDRSMFYKTWIGTNNVLKYRTNVDNI